jgi:WD40 repeat protein
MTVLASPTPPDPWTVAIHRRSDDHKPVGAGVVVDQTRVLTCAHVVRSEGRWLDEAWVAFPKAAVPPTRRLRVIRWDKGYDTDRLDLVMLELAEPVPEPVIPARIRCLPAAAMTGHGWWTFGFPGGQLAGDEARGTVGPPLAFGLVKLDTGPSHKLEVGFSGAGIWLPEYQAVVGLVVAAAPGSAYNGNGHALTTHYADWARPELKLSILASWSADAADEPALAAWGWSLHTDPEAGRHWRPRARGVAAEGEHGYRFRGRTEALTEIVHWLDRATPDKRILVITGSPGVGKSAVLGRVVTTADPELRRQLPTDDRSVLATEGSIACAVHAKGKTALEISREIARAASVVLPDSPDLLLPALRQRLTKRERRFNLVVDALDEAAGPEQARQLVRTVLLPLAAGFPDLDAQVLVGTRRADDTGDLLATFGTAASVIDLDDPDYFAEQDLIEYAAATLQQAGAARPDYPYADPMVAAGLAQRIAALAGRNFLVAGLIAAAHGRYDTEPADKVSFTPTVDAALDAYIAGLSTPDARLALTVLAYAEPPGLPLPLWRAGVKALGGQSTEDALASLACGAAANFLVETNTGPNVRAYRLYHHALGEALLRGRETVASRADDERRMFQAWRGLAERGGWSAAYEYLLRSLPVHAQRAGRLDELLVDDRYLLHADLRRVLQVADGATTPLGKARVRLLQRTPSAIGAEPAERAAMFSVTEQLDRLGSGFSATATAPYFGRWARTPPRNEVAALEASATGVLAVCPVPVGNRNLLASAGEDRTVRLWDPTTGQPERVLTGHTDWIRALCAIPTGDRQLLATASDDHSVRLWDPTTGQPERVLTGHTDWIRALCAIPTGDRHLLATASDDHTARLWDPSTGECTRVLDEHPGWVTAACPITVAGRQLLATAGYDTMIRLWDPSTGRLAHAVEGGAAWVTAVCAVEVEGRELLAIAGYDNAVSLWDPATGRLPFRLTGHTGPITGLCTLPGGLAVASEDGTVWLWDLATGTQLKVLEGHTDRVRGACVVAVAGRQLLVSAGDDGTVRLWDPGTGQPERVIEGAGPVVGLCTVAGRLASTGWDGAVRLWDPSTGDPYSTLIGHTAAVTSVCAVTAGERRLLGSAGEDRTIRLWEPDTGRPYRVLTGDQAAVTALSQAGSLIAAASDTLRLWNPGTAQVDRVLGHMRWVTAVCAISVEGRELLASADEDGVVRLWDPVNGELERELRCHHAATTALCAVPAGDGFLLASASDDHTIQLWEPASGARVWALHGHTGPVTGLCVVPATARPRDARGRTSGRRRGSQVVGRANLLASTSRDRTVRLWDPATGAAQLSIPVYHAALSCSYESDTLVIGLDAGLLGIGIS